MRNNIQIIRKNVKNYNLRIKPNLEIILSVPLHVSETEINNFISKKEQWITEKVNYFSQYKQFLMPKEYVNGESLLYLGNKYTLKVIEDKKNDCFLDNENIYLYVSDKSDFNKKEFIVNKFYKNISKEVFKEILDDTLELFNEKNNVIFQVRKMKSIWGSCNKGKRKITLNSNLVMQERSFIEYVIAHEVAHLKHANHSKTFYSWLSIHMPDWKERKNKMIA